ncbi:MAG: 4-hydroxythreonine-4-phosphate dehydrogenase PdxA [Bacteroidales bacterium]|nr:4-hydroxythreonine-4-phosphate dehydrogenase PdxA [Bacteroidales bacterium]
MAQKIVIGITQGDSNGIGYEVIIKAMSDPRMAEICVPILYGSSRLFGQYRKQIPDTDQINTNVINSAADARSKRLNIINCVPDNLAVEPGQPTLDGAKGAIASLEAAVKDLKEGNIDALVTGPINKHTIIEAGFKYAGHTEYLVKESGAEDGLMLLCADSMKVGICTNHIPISKVPSTLSQELILRKLRLMNDSLMRDFAVVKPKIAVLGLNPHSGDGGSLGNEEIEIINPAIETANQENILAFGPYSPDGFFGAHMQFKFDAVLAMYHDQGLIPFKALAFDKGVNFTAGLPFVRTSPDHGTGYDIAGKIAANPASLVTAIYMAIDVCNNRRRYDSMRGDSLQ